MKIYDLIKDYNKKCAENIPIILFFYSNNDNFIDAAESTGYILSSLKTQENKIMVYSFDFDLDTNLITLLKNKHNIKQPNTIVINEIKNIENLKNINQVKEYIDVNPNVNLGNDVIRL